MANRRSERLPVGGLFAPADKEQAFRALARAAASAPTTGFVASIATPQGRLLHVTGAIGRRIVGGQVDRLWELFHPVPGPKPLTEPGNERGPFGTGTTPGRRRGLNGAPVLTGTPSETRRLGCGGNE